MLDVTFKIDGRRMRDLGLELQSPLALSAPNPRVSTVKIPGRNGDLHYYDGSYDNRDLSGDCFILGADVMRKIGEINAFLLSKRGYRRIELDEDPEHFMLGRSETGLSFKIVKGVLTACSVSFDVKPQRFLKYGEKEVNVTESKEIRNPSAFISLPVIAVEGAGNVTLSSAEWSLNIKNLSGKVVYDAETLCAYSDEFNQNYHTAVSGNVVLSPGDNAFKVTGNVSAVKIIPRWWEL